MHLGKFLTNFNLRKITRFGSGFGTPDDCGVEVGIDSANVATSEVKGKPDLQKPVLDMDYECMLVPSTSGKGCHLYINKEVSKQDYEALLTLLVKMGLYEAGCLKAFSARGWSAVRLPWVEKKPEDAPSSRSDTIKENA